ncbi:PAQR family membrane homeostasis protein TrhA [Proteiniclasticum ruminis]|uniref:Hemolysin III n=1 Tax=Proteiniclasticum ruminis TaxID=398199 RepID=A0A1G8QSQ7_9CLOT|nr:hemolysin III family protein [Proteiniclasticum ruminis]MBP9921090.1 hemolysin III family protein [Proteiniclasticum sp.]SDJ07728.1 hemolysin III [Proteiniclasticum ruminis]
MKKSKLREPVNAWTHLGGAILFFIGTIVMLVHRIVTEASVKSIVGVIIFGLSLVLLYLASGIYHSYNGSEKVIKKLKKLDHSMIYVLIAGSYTPMCLMVLEGQQRVVILSVIWGIALFGILSKIFIPGIPRVLYTLFYLMMGWMVIFFIGDVYSSIPQGGFLLLLFGGILYSIGGIIYMIKKPNFSKVLGFHELFHLFILGGSLLHYFFTFFYLA